MSSLQIMHTGPQALLQDAGRFGHCAIGVGRSGAADVGAYTLGSRLVAHNPGLAAIEITLGGLVARIHGSMTVALTGADTAARLDGAPVAHAAPLDVRDGQELRLGMPSAGLRTYLTVRGGWDVPAELGSRSADTLSGIGPPPLTEGDMLAVGAFQGAFPNVDVAPVPLPSRAAVMLRVTPGPRTQWFADAESLGQRVWTVSDRSNRIGVRLSGPALRRAAERERSELPSEGMVRGCVQVPPDGQPVLFGNDHPVTGGYPVIAVATAADMDLAAQVVPGQQVVLRWKQ